MKISKLFKKRRMGLLLKYLSFAVLFFIIIANLTKFKIIAGSDTSWFINPLYLDRLFVWDKTNFGSFYQIADAIPLGLFYYFFHLLDISNEIIQTFYYFILYFGSFLTFRYALKKILNVDKDLVATEVSSFLYVFNPYMLVSPFHDRLLPVLLFLPLLFLWYYKLLNERNIKYALYIALVSILFSGSNINPPVVSIIPILFLSYFIYFLVVEKKKRKNIKIILLQQLFLFVSYLLANAWHFLVDTFSLLSVSRFGEETNQFRALDTGHIFDNFRLMGQWAWNQFHYLHNYFSFGEIYYSPILAFTTYLIIIFSLGILFLLFSERVDFKKSKMYLFFLMMFFVGLLFANGTKGILGIFYALIYSSNDVFWMFREPWAKFTPIMVFSLPFIFFASFHYFYKLFKKVWQKYLFSLLIVLILLINIFPYFTGDVVWDKWNGTMRTNRVEVPGYWKEMNEYISSNLDSSERLAIFPYNFIYMAFNWPQGFFASSGPALQLIDNPVANSTSLPLSYSDILYSKTFDEINDDGFNLRKYLGLLNIRYVLQENDADWRYTNGGKILPPSKSNKIITDSNFEKVYEAGEFSPEYLSSISNEEPDSVLRDELYDELSGKSALVLYKSKDDEYFLPRFYSVENLLFSNKPYVDLGEIISKYSFNPDKTAVIFRDQNTNIENLKNEEKYLIAEQISYDRINPTRYNIRISGLDNKKGGKLALVFAESYNDNWRLQPKKGGYSSNSLRSEHLVANGYANCWIVDLDSANVENDGSLELVAEFSSQRIYYIGIFVSALFTLFAIVFLISVSVKERSLQVQ